MSPGAGRGVEHESPPGHLPGGDKHSTEHPAEAPQSSTEHQPGRALSTGAGQGHGPSLQTSGTSPCLPTRRNIPASTERPGASPATASA